MDGEKWVGPALFFVAGAVLGRVFGIKTLVRGTLAAATMAGLGAAQTANDAPARAPGRKIAHRTARKKPVQKRSKAVA